MSVKKKYIIGNWKSNKTSSSSKTWFKDLNTALITNFADNVVVAIAPAFSLLEVALEAKKEFPRLASLKIATQDISPFTAGSYTGAVCAENVEGLGIEFAIVGHSERRRYFHETHQDVANKVARCLESGITPIVCVDDEYIADQAAAIDNQHLSKCIVAYEELSAIGTGKNETPEHVTSVIERVTLVFGSVPVLYGGSVKPGNIDQYLDITDGVLVGGASLKGDSFAQIASAAW